MVRQSLLSVVVAAAFFAPPVLAQGDRLVIDNIDPAGVQDTRPNRGMSMDTVEARWGSPTVKRNAVGDPPITRWEYPGFVVYFEFRNVIHSVQTHS